ncbi:tetratricopeptide repeat protein, partial [bacterium]
QKLLLEYPHSTYSASAFYSLGWCLFEQGKFQGAKDKFMAMKQAFPVSPLAKEADLKLAECLYQLKDYAGLRNHLELFLKSVSGEGEDSALLKFYLAESCYYLQDYPCAKENYASARKLSRDDDLISLIELGLGWCALKANEYPEAKTHFEQILKTQGEENAWENALLGEALSRQISQELEPALESYEKLIIMAKNPATRLDAILGKAEVLCGLARYKEAVAVYEQAGSFQGPEFDQPKIARLTSGAAEAVFYLGKAYYDNGDYLSGYLSLRNFRDKFPVSSLKDRALILEGLCLKSLRRYQEACGIFRLSAGSSQDSGISARAELELNDCLYTLGKIEEALSGFEAIRAKYPPSEATVSLALLKLAGHYAQENKLDLSKGYLLDLISSRPEPDILDEAYQRIVKVCKAMGDLKEAISYYRLSLKESPRDLLRRQFQLAEYLEEAGEFQEAIGLYSGIAGDSALLAKGLLRCANISENSGDWESALRFYGMAAELNVPESRFAIERIETIKGGDKE